MSLLVAALVGEGSGCVSWYSGQVLHWPAYAKVRDTPNVMLAADDERAFRLLEKMIDSVVTALGCVLPKLKLLGCLYHSWNAFLRQMIGLLVFAFECLEDAGKS